jgi:CubicO group peptidase (beta-lactamase class C family)
MSIKAAGAALILAASLVACAGPEPVAAPLAPDTRAEEALPDNFNILFWTPEETEVGFRRIDEVAPTRTVERGARVHPLPRAAGPELEVSFTHDGEEYDVERYMEAYRVSGVLVVKDGQILLERYALGRRPEDRWISFSVTKSITATLIGAAIKDGFIESLDAPVERHVEELKGSSYEGVTIRQLLTMSSGVAWNEDYGDPNSDVARAGVVTFEGEASPILAYMRRLGRAHPAGEHFNYSTGETDLAGYVLSRAVGMTTSEYLSRKVWAAYGMERNATWVLDASGHERGGCCLSMTVRDYARVGQFMLDGGAGVLPEGWIEDATSMHMDFGQGERGYGYFWWISPGAYDARGIFGQTIHVVPEQKLVVVTNSAWVSPVDRASGMSRAAFLDAVTAAVKARGS